MIRFIWLWLCLLFVGCSTVSNVALVNNTITIRVPTLFMNSTINQWDNIDRVLINTHASTIILLWEGRGGSFDVGERVKNAILAAKQQGKTVIIRVVGFAASLHAYMICNASQIEYTNNAVLMFHVAANMDNNTIISGYNPDLINMINVCINKGVLTNQDSQAILSVKELWLFRDHKEIRFDGRKR